MIAKRIGLGLLALLLGAAGFIVLFAVGEGSGSGLLAYAVDTALFALAAYGLSRLDHDGRLLYAVLMCAPVLLLSVGGADSGGALLSILMTAITIAAAVLPPPPAGVKS